MKTRLLAVTVLVVGIVAGVAIGAYFGQGVGYMNGVRSQAAKIAIIQTTLARRDAIALAQRKCIQTVKQSIDNRAAMLNTDTSFRQAGFLFGKVFGDTMRCSKTAGMAYVSSDDLTKLTESL